MIITRRINGYIEQKIDMNTGKCLSQNLIVDEIMLFDKNSNELEWRESFPDIECPVILNQVID